METFELLIATGMVCATAYLMLRAYLNNRYQMHKSKMTSQARTQRKKTGEVPSAEVADWVLDLLDQYGIDEDLIYEDEMPEELNALLPLVSGFVKGGGLQKIMGGVSQPAVQKTDASELEV